MYEVPSVDVFLCLKLLLPFLATLELLTIWISPRSALFVPGKNGGLTNEPVSNDGNGNNSVLIFDFLNITEW